jgi:hydrogenase maturation factor
LAEASEVGFRVEFEKIPISPEVSAIKKTFRLSEDQMLSLSSTGTLVAAVDAHAKDKVEETLRRNGFSGSFLGAFTKSQSRILVKNKRTMPFPRVADDPYDRILLSKV